MLHDNVENYVIFQSTTVNRCYRSSNQSHLRGSGNRMLKELVLDMILVRQVKNSFGYHLVLAVHFSAVMAFCSSALCRFAAAAALLRDGG